MKYKRFYLTASSISILVILALVGGYIEYYDNYEDVIVCSEECWVTFCMKNGGHNLYFYNKEELPLTFSDDSVINGVEFFKKDGRFKTGYRPIDFITPYTKNRLYVFKIPAYSYTCYGMKIYKEASATVKWIFLGLDPVLQAPDGNLTYIINPSLNDTNLDQNFQPDWSTITGLVNFSNSTILNSGNFSWNFTQYNISTNVTDWVYNFTNNESNNNFTVWAKLNQSFDNLQVWFSGVVSGDFTEYCYQETANVSTVCGGLSTGSYIIPETEFNYTRYFIDGNWATDFTETPGNDTILINYTVPNGVSEAIITYKIYQDKATDTLNITCYNGSTDIQIKYLSGNKSLTENQTVPSSCINSNVLLNYTFIATSELSLYEEAIYWNISSTSSTIKINISDNTYTELFNLIINESQLMNVTIDLLNISQAYTNWTIIEDTTNFNFNVTFNVTAI